MKSRKFGRIMSVIIITLAIVGGLIYHFSNKQNPSIEQENEKKEEEIKPKSNECYFCGITIWPSDGAILTTDGYYVCDNCFSRAAFNVDGEAFLRKDKPYSLLDIARPYANNLYNQKAIDYLHSQGEKTDQEIEYEKPITIEKFIQELARNYDVLGDDASFHSHYISSFHGIRNEHFPKGTVFVILVASKIKRLSLLDRVKILSDIRDNVLLSVKVRHPDHSKDHPVELLDDNLKKYVWNENTHNFDIQDTSLFEQQAILSNLG